MVTSSQAWTRLSVPRQCLGGHRKTNYDPETASKGPNWVTIRGQAPGSIFGSHLLRRSCPHPKIRRGMRLWFALPPFRRA